MRLLEVVFVLVVLGGLIALAVWLLQRRPRRGWEVDTASRDGATLVLLRRDGDEDVVKALKRADMDELDYRAELEMALQDAAAEAAIRNRAG